MILTEKRNCRNKFVEIELFSVLRSLIQGWDQGQFRYYCDHFQGIRARFSPSCYQELLFL